jgi:hypothetical protein
MFCLTARGTRIAHANRTEDPNIMSYLEYLRLLNDAASTSVIVSYQNGKMITNEE